MLLDVRPDHFQVVREILRRLVPDREVWAFGSRAKWTARDTSDLDLCIVGDTPLGFKRLGQLRDAFSESSLPYKVDVVDWATTSESFREIIERDKVVGQKASPSLGMAGDIASAALRDLLLTTKDGDWGKESPERGSVPYRVIRGTDFPGVRIGDTSSVPVRYLSEATVHRRTLRPDDILLETAGGSPGRPTGRSLLITERLLSSLDLPATCARFARFLRVDPSKAVPRYVYWYLQYLYASGQMEEYQVQHTGVARFQYTKFAETEQIPLPASDEQRAIAHILGTLDDKIELNRRMNETLEAMARAFFKSWFVDFDPVRAKAEGRDPGLPQALADLFPDSFEDSDLGEIPKGWEINSIGDLADVAGGATPSTKEPAYWAGGTHAWATPKDLSGLSVPVLLDTERRITDAGLSQIGSGLLPKGTVLLSSRAPIGYLAVAEIPVAINQGFIAMTPKRGTSNLFLLLWASVAHEEIVSRANGSTFLEISKANFRPIPVVTPSADVMRVFEELARPLYERIVESARESRTVAALRDTLLPKLISGELRVRGLKKTIPGDGHHEMIHDSRKQP